MQYKRMFREKTAKKAKKVLVRTLRGRAFEYFFSKLHYGDTFR